MAMTIFKKFFYTLFGFIFMIPITVLFSVFMIGLLGCNLMEYLFEHNHHYIYTDN